MTCKDHEYRKIFKVMISGSFSKNQYNFFELQNNILYPFVKIYFFERRITSYLIRITYLISYPVNSWIILNTPYSFENIYSN